MEIRNETNNRKTNKKKNINKKKHALSVYQ